MTRYKSSLLYTGLLWFFIPFFFVFSYLAFTMKEWEDTLFVSTLPIVMLFAIHHLVHSYNYIEVTDEEIIVRNRLLGWKKYHFTIQDIAHISFGQTSGKNPCIYFKVLTPSRWSKRCYLGLVTKKRIKAFAQHLETLDIPYNKVELQKFVKY